MHTSIRILSLLFLFSFAINNSQSGVVDLVVSSVAENRDHVVVELQARQGVSRRAQILTPSEAYNGLKLNGRVDVANLVLQFRQHDIQVTFERERSDVVNLLFEGRRQQRIGFATARMGRSIDRLYVTLYFDRGLDYDAMYERAETLYASGMESEAMRHWEYILSRYGVHRQSLHRVANLHLEAGRSSEAEPMFGKVIDLDERNWHYPEARIRFAIARDKQQLPLRIKHQMCLEDYIRYDKGQQLGEARRLLIQSKQPATMLPVTVKSARSLNQRLDRSRRSIVHFWNPESASSWEDLNKLFTLSVRHRDIMFYFIAVNDGNRKSDHEWALSKQFAPYQSLRGAPNVQFLLDEQSYVLQLLYSNQVIPVIATSQTLYLQKKTVVRHEKDMVSEVSLNPALIWNKN